MEHNFAEASPDTAAIDQLLAEDPALHLQDPFSGNSFSVFDNFEDLLELDFTTFDFDMLNLNSLPPTPPPPTTATVVTVDSISSEDSNARASGPGPVVPTAGLERGKSVVSSEIGGGGEKLKRRRRTSFTVAACGPVICQGNRGMNPEQLAELARVDPKRVKRIIGNRKSAAKSKARKTKYEKELEEKVPQLKIQAARLAASVSMHQRNGPKLDVRDKELSITRDAVLQRVLMKDAIVTGVKEEYRIFNIGSDNINMLLSLSDEEFVAHFSSKSDQQTQLSMPNPHQLPSSGKYP